ncbi:MAG: hypothetical protein R2717_09705 [Schumannella sp.]
MTKPLGWPAFACFLGGWFVVFWAGAQNVASGILTAQLLAIIVGSLVLIGFNVPERRTQLGSEVLEHLQGLRDYLALAEEDRPRVLQSPQGAQRSRVDPRDDARPVRLYEKLPALAIVWGVEREWNGVLGDRYEYRSRSLRPIRCGWFLVDLARRLLDEHPDHELRTVVVEFERFVPSPRAAAASRAGRPARILRRRRRRRRGRRPLTSRAGSFDPLGQTGRDRPQNASGISRQGSEAQPRRSGTWRRL